MIGDKSQFSAANLATSDDHRPIKQLGNLYLQAGESDELVSKDAVLGSKAF